MITKLNDLTEINFLYLYQELERLTHDIENVHVIMLSSLLIRVEHTNFGAGALSVSVNENGTLATLVCNWDDVLIGTPVAGQLDFETEFANAVIEYVKTSNF